MQKLEVESIKMLKDEINESLKNAMKSKDEKLTNALRNIKAKVLEADKKDVTKDVSDNEVLAILTKLAKERRQSIDMYKQGNRQDLVDAETYELGIIESYLPKQLSEDEIQAKVKELIAENNFTTVKDMGKAIKLFNEKFPNMAEGRIVSQVVKNNLA
jgi:uncharacterized protein YqeY